MTDHPTPSPPYHARPRRFVDTETLGFRIEQPIVELAILDEFGRPLFNKKIAPPPSRRPDAEAHLPSYRLELAHEEAAVFSGYIVDGKVSPEWDDALELHHHAPAILKALTGTQVWGHTTWFDTERLRWWLTRYGIELPPRFATPAFDVATLAAEHMPYLRSMSLTSIAQALGISTDQAHTAAGDARMVFEIHRRLAGCSREDRGLFRHNYDAMRRGAGKPG